LRPEEEYDIRTGERLLAYTVVAQDAIVLVVNEDNPLRQLAMHEIRGMFEGRTSNWAEVGGHDADIVVISREDGSGTREAFEEAVMRGRRVAPTALIMPSSQAVSDYVRLHEGAIGYLSLGWLGPGIAALAVDDIEPTREAVEDRSYPIVRPLLLVSRPQPEGDILGFLQFASSPAGQALVGRTYGRAGSLVPR
jgi:phosphate transport system substrate-binding protein